MSEKTKTIDNGAAGLRLFANIITAIAIFGFVWGLLFVFIGDVSWSSFGCFALLCVGAVVLRFILLALATIAEAASLYLKNKSNNG